MDIITETLELLVGAVASLFVSGDKKEMVDKQIAKKTDQMTRSYDRKMKELERKYNGRNK